MKKFILHIMACLMMAVMISTCFGAADTALADDVAHRGELTVAGEEDWWGQHDTTMAEVLGDVALEDVTYIRFYADAGFVLGYNNGVKDWFQTEKITEYKMTDLNRDPMKWTLAIVANETVGTDVTVKWEVYTASKAVEEPKAEEPKAEAPAADLVALDISERPFVSGEAPADNADGSITFSNGKTMKSSFALPEKLAAGESITVNVKLKFGSADDAGVRFYLIANASDVNIATAIEAIANENTGNTIEKTFVLTAASDATELLFASSSYGVYINDVTIYDITLGEKPAEAPAEEPKVEEPVEEPKAEEPVEEPKAEEPAEEPKAEEPMETTTADKTKDGREVLEGEAIYVVKKGDCLWSIAKQLLGKGSKYPELFERNKDILKEATLIFPSQEIIIPAK